ncbi:hypothetical protein B0H10DRAFT_2101689 [Mycena sp. CBHHK59/15]|nr:hypothetical protein B0H10DRAFT_2101689 [Mycena sp. CBHHK59/15]
MSNRTTPLPSQRQQSGRPVVFGSFPTIKVIEPPKGTFSTRNDQWCLTYCSQNVRGRIQSQAPFCRSMCIRKVFPHEVRNIIQFKSHQDVGPDGKARYPLPVEGQPINLPRYLGGKPSDDPEHGRKSPDDTKYWDEGWYLWKTNGASGVWANISQMHNSLEGQGVANSREVWKDYQDFLRSGTPPVPKWLGPSVPPYPGSESDLNDSLLVHLPLETGPLLEPIQRVLAPAHRALELFHDNFTSGNYRKFSLRVWDKALTKDPLTLAQRACNFAYEQWKDKDRPDEDDKEKA